MNRCSFGAVWRVDFSFLLLLPHFFFFYIYCCSYHTEMNISPLWFWPALGWLIVCLQIQKLNTLLQSTWKFDCHFNAAQETKSAIYECTELKYVETRCLSSESQRHSVDILLTRSIHFLWECNRDLWGTASHFFPHAFYHQHACMHQQGAQACSELRSSWVQYVSGDS